MKFGASILAIAAFLTATLVAACDEQTASLPPRIEVVVEATAEAAPERMTTESPLSTPVATPTPTPEPPQLASVPTPTPAPATAWLPTALPKPTTPTATPTGAPAPPTAIPFDTSTPTTTWLPFATPAPTPTSTTAEGSRLIYEFAVAAMDDLSSYRLRTNTILAIMGMARISIDSYAQPPDLEKAKIVVAGGSNTPIETGRIVAGGYTYIKPSANLFPADDPNRGKWIRESTGDEPSDEFEGGLLSEIRVDELVGIELVDGVETVRLKGVVDLESGFGIDYWADTDEPMEVHIWIGAADNLIRRITAATAPTTRPVVGVTMIFSDFDVPVEIEAPKDYIVMDSEQLPDTPRYEPEEITPLSSGWTLAHLRDYGFSVSTPPDWFSSYSDMPASSVASDLRVAMIQYVFPGQITAYEGDETRVSVFNAAIIGTLGDATLSEYVDKRLEHAEAALVIDGAIERRAVTLPTGEAEVVEFAFRFPDEVFSVFGDTALGMDYDADTDYAQIQYFILAEGSAFILTFATTADRIDAMRPSFAEIAQTARIEPRS